MAASNQTTQNFVPIKEVRDGIIVLKDGSMRAVLMTSSVNFALKSEDEQKSIIFQFQNFLNSLNFDIQIFTQSRRLDVRPYINTLEQREKEQTNDLMKVQTREYIQFIKTFTEQVNIMNKRFFVVVPYSPISINLKKGKSFFSGLGGGGKKDKITDDSNFTTNRSQLEQRIDIVVQGLNRSGVRSVQLGTEEVIELFYQLYNPGEVEKPIVEEK